MAGLYEANTGVLGIVTAFDFMQIKNQAVFGRIFNSKLSREFL
jgi:hypothetical protein